MKLPSVGVIGGGFVGCSLASCFKHYCDVKLYDIDPMKTVNDYFKVISQDVLFMALPTPMKKDGSVDASFVTSALNTLASATLETHKLVIIKSTLPPKILVDLSKLFSPTLHIVYSPEFLTERTAELDMQQTNRLIFGDHCPDREAVGDEVDYKANNMNLISELFTGRFPSVPQFWVSIEQASLIKYFSNMFFASKISIFNEFARITESFGLNANEVAGMVLLDQRIGRSHWQVPGHDGKKGFGGSCFVKDINEYMNIAETQGIQPLMAQAAWISNLTVRPERDWEKLKGRAVSHDFEEEKK